MNRIVILSLLVCLSSCRYSGHLRDLEQQLDRSILNQKEQDTLRVSLDSINSFEWDELIVAGPYTNLETVNGYDLGGFPNTISYHDRYIFFGFILNKKANNWMLVKRYKPMNKLYTIGNGGYKIYSKGNCNFVLSQN